MFETVISYLLGNYSCSTDTQYLAFDSDRCDRLTHSLTSVYMTRLKPREKLRDGQKQKEQEVRNELQTFYNKKMENLEEAVHRQKQANEEANKRALLKINMQQEEITMLQREYNIIKQEKERQQHKV